MKKALLLLMLMCGTCSTIWADGTDSTSVVIDVSLYFDSSKPGGVFNNPHSPVHPPKVQLSDHTLLVYLSCDYTVQLIKEDEDGNDVVAYSQMVFGTPGLDSILLPSLLEGEYKLRLYVGSLCFSGFINLLKFRK